MEDKKYLKWYNKVGYGSGDVAGNVVFAFVSSFVMIYLTNMGLPESIRDKGKVLCKYPNISSWVKKDIGVNVAYPGLICVHLDL